jgi:hypothetical protein
MGVLLVLPFKKVYECDLAGTVEVVARRSGPRVVHTLRQFPATRSQEILNVIGSLRHENVSSALGYFCFENILYAIGDFYPLTLGHIVACKAFPTELQLNAFMVQVGFQLPSGKH